MFSFQASPLTIFDHKYSDLDLISPEVAPSQLKDPAALLIHIGQVIFSLHVISVLSSTRDIEIRSYGRAGSRLEETEFGSQTHVHIVKPVLYGSSVHPTSAVNQTVEAWDITAMSLLLQSADNFSLLSHDRDAFPREDSGAGMKEPAYPPRAVCFKSIISTGEIGNKLPRPAMGPDNHFFKRNNISRKQRWKIASHMSREFDNEVARDGQNLVRASPIDVQDTYVNLLICSTYLATEDVEALVNRLQKRLQLRASENTIRLNASVAYVSGTTDAQVALKQFQAADIVLAAHSPLLQNVLYMRPKSLLIEVTPFSAVCDSYGLFASQLNVSYVSVMARADTKWFKWCIQRSMGPSSAQHLQLLLNAWEEAADRFDDGDRRSHLRLSDETSPWHADAPGARECALQQTHLKIRNIDYVERAMFDHAVVPRL
jgi:hypothetical protein